MPWPKGSFDDFRADGPDLLPVLRRLSSISMVTACSTCSSATMSPGRRPRTWGPPLSCPVEAGPRSSATISRHAVHALSQLGRRKVPGCFESTGVLVRRAAGNTRPVGKSLGVIVCDPDNDGWPDIVVANDTVRNFFFHNVPDPRAAGAFRKMASSPAGLRGRPAAGGMGIDAGEVSPASFQS